MSHLRRLLHKLYLSYLRWCPISRGKHRIGVILDSVVGQALYTVDGISVKLSPVSLIDRKLIIGEGHDRPVMDVIQRSLSTGGNFIDVGANIGCMSLLAARTLGEAGVVFSFEPSPREYRRLVDNMKLNAFSNIRTFNQGIGQTAENGVLHLATIGNPGMNSRHITARGSTSIEARFAPICEVVTDAELQGVRCVKIDVEGDEMSALMGFETSMHLLRGATFVVEVVADYLDRAGYTPNDIYSYFDRHSFLPVNGAVPRNTFQYDAVFVSSESARAPQC